MAERFAAGGSQRSHESERKYLPRRRVAHVQDGHGEISRNLKRSMIPQLNTVPGIVVLELQCPAQKISKPIL